MISCSPGWRSGWRSSKADWRRDWRRPVRRRSRRRLKRGWVRSKELQELLLHCEVRLRSCERLKPKWSNCARDEMRERLRNQREGRDHIVLDTTERAWEFVQGVEEVTEKASLVTIWWVVMVRPCNPLKYNFDNTIPQQAQKTVLKSEKCGVCAKRMKFGKIALR